MYLKLILLNDIMHKDITTVQTANNIAKFMPGLKWTEEKTKLLEKNDLQLWLEITLIHITIILKLPV